MKWEQVINDPSIASRLSEDQITELLDQVSKCLVKEGPVIDLEAGRILFVGDTHGDFDSTISIVNRFFENNYDYLVFLGDYVDRGYDQTGNVNYIFALKVLFPDKVFLLRGNHETPLANMYYGFVSEVYTKYSPKLYQEYCRVFSQLPYIVVIDEKVIGLHGGIPNPVLSLKNLRKNLRKGLVNVDERSPLEFQLLWNDPEEHIQDFSPSFRGYGIYLFGKRAFDKFMEESGLKFMIRAHEVFENGYKFFFNNRLLSIFSARNYGMPIDAKVAELTRDREIKLIPV